MSTEEKKPAAPIDLSLLVTPPVPAAPVVHKTFGGGIEPGTMHGARRESIAPRSEQDDGVLEEVRKMDAAQYRKWLKTPGNKERINAASAAKKARHE